ncbi:ArsR/SmtB family transcription factor [Halorussus ruber]|uniref:ArsR/SmtB family transcription factor n=1 Tax=Halorussus ruber TaxID=1126238 RepID=UPI00109299E2|nr:helix-turn-helix domain-containing protein [Halorussus ruber]
MADLLPSSPDPSAGDGGEPRVIGVDSDDADDLLSALQSETARDLLGTLYEDPATPSALAEEADTSIQNVRYHLERLDDADLVEVADTIYSEKGREMKVYAPAAKPLVVFAGGEDDAPGLESALSKLLGALGILGLSSLLVQRVFGGPNALGGPLSGVEFSGEDGGYSAATTQDTNLSAGPSGQNAESTTDSAGAGSGQELTTAEEQTTATDAQTTATDAKTTAEKVGDSGATTEEPRETVTESAETVRTVAETTRTAGERAAEATTTVVESGGAAGGPGDVLAGGFPPGLVFFAGGLVVLLSLGAAWYLRAR